MTEQTYLELLLEDIEETLDVEGEAAIYEFRWLLRGLDPQPTEPQIERLSLQGYTEINRRHDLRLVWMGWPTAYLGEVAEGEELHWDFDEAGRHMVLVPVDWEPVEPPRVSPQD